MQDGLLKPDKRLGIYDEHGYEAKAHIRRYMVNQWLMPFHQWFDWRYRKFGIDEVEKNIFLVNRILRTNRSVSRLGSIILCRFFRFAQAEVLVMETFVFNYHVKTFLFQNDYEWHLWSYG
jgi:hypothetical protein